MSINQIRDKHTPKGNTLKPTLRHGSNKTKMLHVLNRREWRGWLKKHRKIEKDVWLIYYRKKTNTPRILYNDAVEEALCFGWIDSQAGRRGQVGDAELIRQNPPSIGCRGSRRPQRRPPPKA